MKETMTHKGMDKLGVDQGYEEFQGSPQLQVLCICSILGNLRDS